jgi:hypothetical protein
VCGEDGELTSWVNVGAEPVNSAKKDFPPCAPPRIPHPYKKSFTGSLLLASSDIPISQVVSLEVRPIQTSHILPSSNNK